MALAGTGPGVGRFVGNGLPRAQGVSAPGKSANMTGLSSRTVAPWQHHFLLSKNSGRNGDQLPLQSSDAYNNLVKILSNLRSLNAETFRKFTRADLNQLKPYLSRTPQDLSRTPQGVPFSDRDDDHRVKLNGNSAKGTVLSAFTPEVMDAIKNAIKTATSSETKGALTSLLVWVNYAKFPQPVQSERRGDISTSPPVGPENTQFVNKNFVTTANASIQLTPGTTVSLAYSDENNPKILNILQQLNVDTDVLSAIGAFSNGLKNIQIICGTSSENGDFTFIIRLDMGSEDTSIPIDTPYPGDKVLDLPQGMGFDMNPLPEALQSLIPTPTPTPTPTDTAIANMITLATSAKLTAGQIPGLTTAIAALTTSIRTSADNLSTPMSSLNERITTALATANFSADQTTAITTALMTMITTGSVESTPISALVTDLTSANGEVTSSQVTEALTTALTTLMETVTPSNPGTSVPISDTSSQVFITQLGQIGVTSSVVSNSVIPFNSVTSSNSAMSSQLATSSNLGISSQLATTNRPVTTVSIFSDITSAATKLGVSESIIQTALAQSAGLNQLALIPGVTSADIPRITSQLADSSGQSTSVSLTDRRTVTIASPNSAAASSSTGPGTTSITVAGSTGPRVTITSSVDPTGSVTTTTKHSDGTIHEVSTEVASGDTTRTTRYPDGTTHTRSTTTTGDTTRTTKYPNGTTHTSSTTTTGGITTTTISVSPSSSSPSPLGTTSATTAGTTAGTTAASLNIVVTTPARSTTSASTSTTPTTSASSSITITEPGATTSITRGEGGTLSVTGSAPPGSTAAILRTVLANTPPAEWHTVIPQATTFLSSPFVAGEFTSSDYLTNPNVLTVGSTTIQKTSSMIIITTPTAPTSTPIPAFDTGPDGSSPAPAATSARPTPTPFAPVAFDAAAAGSPSQPITITASKAEFIDKVTEALRPFLAQDTSTGSSSGSAGYIAGGVIGGLGATCCVTLVVVSRKNRGEDESQPVDNSSGNSVVEVVVTNQTTPDNLRQELSTQISEASQVNGSIASSNGSITAQFTFSSTAIVAV